MEAIARTPESDAPIAVSSAVFSLDDHSQYTSRYCARLSLISVLGVPGYAAETFTPAS